MSFARHLRNNATEAERLLWTKLSTFRPRFTRQLPIGPFVADFACRKAKLIVELDGSQHVESEGDERRTALLASDGWHVVRFWNSDLVENVEGVVEAIALAVSRRVPDELAPHFVTSRAGRERSLRSRDLEKKSHS